MFKQVKTVDVIIVGAGIVGRAMACALSQLDLKVVLLDQRALETTMTDEIDLRVSALSHASQALLEELGVWQAMCDMRVSPYREMYVWNDEGNIHFDAAEIAKNDLGHVVENQVTQAALAKAILDNELIDVMTSSKVINLQVFHDSVQILLDDKTCIKAQLVVGADGANSWVRESAGIEISKKAYEQTAIVATVETEKSNQATAWQRFLSTGPLAFLPLLMSSWGSRSENPGSREYLSSIVWSADHTEAQRLMSLSDNEFSNEMTKAFQEKLGQATLKSERKSFPLFARHAKSYTAPRVVLIGDAAHTIHPLAGLGLNLGLKDVISLRQVINEALNAKKDIASMRVLSQYQRLRKKDTLLTMASMRGFKDLFGAEKTMLSNLRNQGLNLADSCQLFKNIVMNISS